MISKNLDAVLHELVHAELCLLDLRFEARCELAGVIHLEMVGSTPQERTCQTCYSISERPCSIVWCQCQRQAVDLPPASPRLWCRRSSSRCSWAFRPSPRRPRRNKTNHNTGLVYKTPDARLITKEDCTFKDIHANHIALVDSTLQTKYTIMPCDRLPWSAWSHSCRRRPSPSHTLSTWFIN